MSQPYRLRHLPCYHGRVYRLDPVEIPASLFNIHINICRRIHRCIVAYKHRSRIRLFRSPYAVVEEIVVGARLPFQEHLRVLRVSPLKFGLFIFSFDGPAWFSGIIKRRDTECIGISSFIRMFSSMFTLLTGSNSSSPSDFLIFLICSAVGVLGFRGRTTRYTTNCGFCLSCSV